MFVGAAMSHATASPCLHSSFYLLRFHVPVPSFQPGARPARARYTPVCLAACLCFLDASGQFRSRGTPTSQVTCISAPDTQMQLSGGLSLSLGGYGPVFQATPQIRRCALQSMSCPAPPPPPTLPQWHSLASPAPTSRVLGPAALLLFFHGGVQRFHAYSYGVAQSCTQMVTFPFLNIILVGPSFVRASERVCSLFSALP